MDCWNVFSVMCKKRIFSKLFGITKKYVCSFDNFAHGIKKNIISTNVIYYANSDKIKFIIHVKKPKRIRPVKNDTKAL